MSRKRPSPNAKANSENRGLGTAQNNDETIVKAAQEAATTAGTRLRRRRRGKVFGWITNTFATDDQRANQIGVVLGVFLLTFILLVLDAIWTHDKDFFVDMSKPIIAIIGAILAYLVGKSTR